MSPTPLEKLEKIRFVTVVFKSGATSMLTGPTAGATLIIAALEDDDGDDTASGGAIGCYLSETNPNTDAGVSRHFIIVDFNVVIPKFGMQCDLRKAYTVDLGLCPRQTICGFRH
jgi:hypothetical protein